MTSVLDVIDKRITRYKYERKQAIEELDTLYAGNLFTRINELEILKDELTNEQH